MLLRLLLFLLFLLSLSSEVSLPVLRCPNALLPCSRDLPWKFHDPTTYGLCIGRSCDGLVPKDKQGRALSEAPCDPPEVAALRLGYGAPPPPKRKARKGGRTAVTAPDRLILPTLQCLTVRRRRYMVQFPIPRPAAGKERTRLNETFGLAQYGSWAAAYKAAEERLRALALVYKVAVERRAKALSLIHN